MPKKAIVTPGELMVTMKISDKTRDRLRSLGAMGDTFDDVIIKLLDEHETAGKNPRTKIPRR